MVQPSQSRSQHDPVLGATAQVSKNTDNPLTHLATLLVGWVHAGAKSPVLSVGHPSRHLAHCRVAHCLVRKVATGPSPLDLQNAAQHDRDTLR